MYTWNLFRHGRTVGVVMVVQADTKAEAETLGFVLKGYLLDADLVRG